MNNSSVAPLESGTQVVPSSEPVPVGVKKKPKKVLHFSDGTLEVTDSSDDDECRQEKVAESQVATVNPGTLEWVPWLFYQTSHAGNKALAVCDYLGEYLANFFGILSPKYEYEIEQYKKMVAEEEEKKKQDLEGGWTPKPSDVVSADPKTESQSMALESLKDSLTQ